MLKKVIVVGATGTIGKSVCRALAERKYEVIPVSRNGEISVDVTDINSIKEMHKKIGSFDALISTIGKVTFKPIEEMSEEEFMFGLKNKLMGQVNLVQEGLKYINDNGSFTLSTGILNRHPIAMGTSAAMVNAAVEGYAKAASLELRQKVRINVVSPTVITEALPTYAPFFPGFKSVDAKDAAEAYVRSVAGIESGMVFKVGY